MSSTPTRTAPIALCVREFRLALDDIDEDRRTVPASLSTERPVRRETFDGPVNEILSHDPEHVDLSRAANGLPLLRSHDAREHVGIVENVHVSPDRRLRGTLRFSRSSAGETVWQDVRDGILQGISIGYRIEPRAFRRGPGDDDLTITHWTPFEASVTPIPEDIDAGIARAIHAEVRPMTQETSHDATATSAVRTPTPTEPQSAAVRAGLDRVREMARAEGVRAEAERADAIRAAFDPHRASSPEFAQLEARMLGDASVTVAQAQSELLAMLAGNPVPISAEPARGAHRVELQADEEDKWRRGVENGLLYRAGYYDAAARRNSAEARAVRESGLAGMRLVEICRRASRHLSWYHGGLSDADLVGLAFVNARAVTPGTADYTVADFPAVLEAVPNKMVWQGWDEAERTWDVWASQGDTPNYNPFTRPGISHISDLPVVAENASYQSLTQTDKKEQQTPKKRGGLISYTREAVLNDDLSVFTSTPLRLGESGQRMVNKDVYAVLSSSYTMTETGLELFHATHGNLTAIGAVPDMAGVEAVRAAMRRQADSNGVVLNINPRFMLVPVELESTAKTLAGAEFDPASTAGTLAPNTVRDSFVPVADAELTDINDWYMAARAGSTVEVVWVGGMRGPQLDREQGWTVDAIHHKVRIEYGVIAVDYRGLYKTAVA